MKKEILDRHFLINRGRRIYATLLLGMAATMGLRAQAFTTLASFNGTNGGVPQSTGSALVQGTDGNFYGTTLEGAGFGSVFKITPAGALTNIYNFCSVTRCADGASPTGLVRGSDGNFYGTTTGNGSGGYGTVFKITPAGVLTTLYSFTGGADGSSANALVQGSDGNFYGTAAGGGKNFGGTVFRITPSGILTTLYNFQSSSKDGFKPIGSLIQGSDGNFYGTTNVGGATVNEAGTVFKITPSGALTILYSFSGNADGFGPAAGLAQATDGNFYGATLNGGANNAGTVYKISPSGSLTTLYNFCSLSNCQDGGGVAGALTQASDGNLYGTTSHGGANNYGTIFKITTSGTFTSLHSFSAVPDGGHPVGALFQGTDGNLYGTTADYGASVSDGGTVFRLQLAASAPPYTCINTTPPVITFVDSASAYGGYSYFASGSWLEIKGTNLADPADPRLTAATNPGQWTTGDFTNGNAPTSLDGISVSINGKPAYVWYLSTGQINVQAPEDTATGNVAITVTNCKATSPMFTFARRALAPGFLAPTNYTANGTQYLVAFFNSDNAYVLNTTTAASFGLTGRPAKPGDLIYTYGIGFGDVTPTVLPGVIGQQANLVNAVAISFGTTPATISYQGLTPGAVGLYQFNFTVPSSLANGDYQINATQNGTTIPQKMYLTVHN